MSETYDIAIVGSGFAGSLLAMIAKRLGRSVLLLERGSHPRVVIGESSTPLSNLLVEELATRYDLPNIKQFSKWGSWQRSHPEVACGLKRGFTFHHHVLGHPESPDPERGDQLLVAASPNDEIADTHWYRADFDHFLVREAQALGVEYIDKVKLGSALDRSEGMSLHGHRNSYEVEYRARFVVDATGPRGFLHHALGLREVDLPDFSDTQSLYSHFSGVARIDSGHYSRTSEQPSFPIDDAAVHHVFDGGWIWVLQFNNGITSAGVAATAETARRLNLKEGEPAWIPLLQLIPALAEQFHNAKPVRPFTYLPQLPFRSGKIAGDNWALMPSAAGFVDPLLSTGFPLTLLGVARLAEVIDKHWSTTAFATELGYYALRTNDELLATARLIGSLYSAMGSFRLFTALTLLYFAAASYSEAARRLGKVGLADSFLLCAHPIFGPKLQILCEKARHVRCQRETEMLVAEILQAIEPFDVAGLCKPTMRNWYPADATDLLESAHKLDSSRSEAQQLLRRCGFEV